MSRIRLTTGMAALALLFMTGNAWADRYCAMPRDATALNVAALQQKLMVAALTCNQTALYNRFVISYRPELQRSDTALVAYFLRRDHRRGTADYHAFKTKLANDASLQSLHNPSYCAEARAVFDVALNERNQPLTDLVSSQPAIAEVSERGCSHGPRFAGQP